MIKAMEDTSQKGRFHLNMLLNHKKITHRVLPLPKNIDSLTPLMSATPFIKRSQSVWGTWACKWFYSPEIMVPNHFFISVIHTVPVMAKSNIQVIFKGC